MLAACLMAACTINADDDDDDNLDEGSAGMEASGGTGGSGGDGGEGGSGGDGGEGGSGGDGGEGGSGGDGGEGGTGGSDETPPDIDLIECETRDPSSATTISGRIDSDATWSGVVYIDGDIDVTDGATLTIEPGTEIIVAADNFIEFGAFSDDATVMAEGTADDPIRFCGEGPDAGFWTGIAFGSNVTSNSVFSHVLISDAGGGDAALTIGMGLTVQSVQIRNAEEAGFDAAAFKDDSELLTVEGGSGVAGIIRGTAAASNFPLGGLLSGNDENVVEVAISRIDADTVFHDIGIPYQQGGSIDVTDDAELTFEAGVEYRFAADADFEIGAFSDEATVFVSGTASDPVVFRGSFEEAGHWEGILIRSNVRSNSVISHAVIMHGGGQSVPALQIDSPITIEDVSLDANTTGMRILGQGLSDESANLSITGTEGAPLDVNPDALVSLPEGGDFTGNDDDYIIVRGGRYEEDGVVPNLGVPYRIDGDIDSQDGTMTISAGTHFIMSADTDIEFGAFSGSASLTAEGTAEDPIRFTASDETPGHWSGLIVQSNVASASSMDYVEVSHGGSGGACLRLAAEISVTNSTFSDCAGYGLTHDADFTTDYSSTNTFENNESGAIDTF